MASGHLLHAICLALLVVTTRAESTDPDVLDIGFRRELFVDHFLIDRIEGVQLVLHEPRPAEKATEIDRPWEGPFSFGLAVWKDGDTYRMYYRGWHAKKVPTWCIAESVDGIHWTKPDLGLVELEGSRENNLVGTVDGEPFANMTGVFLNARPEAPASDKYIGIAPHRPSQSELRVHLWLSPDGVRWRELQDEPVFTTSLFNAFDSAPSLFWSEAEQQYVLYFRYSIRGKPRGPDVIPGVRTVARTTSADLVHWSEPTPMIYGNDGPKPPENLYTNGTHPYFRAPHIYVAFPARFMPGRRVISDEQLAGLNMATFDPWRYHFDCADSVFMTTRGGNTYDRTFMSVFIRPGLGPANWGSRSNYALRGVVQTGLAEMSLYVNRHNAQDTWHVQRMTLRLDGFASVRAPYEGGELLTKPLTFSGRHLVLNYATSAAGSVRVEIQSPDGTPVPGFALSGCRELYGDHIERGVAWKGGADLGALVGKPIRLRFVMKDVDLYSLRFQSEAPKRVAYQRVDPVALPADPVLDFPGGQMTVEAFVYVVPPPSGHAGERILSKYSHVGGDTRRGWEWIILQDGRFQFRVNQAKPGAKDVQGDRALNSRSHLRPKEWVHIATVFDRPNQRMRLYIDGKLEAERKIPDVPMRHTPDQDLVLGRYGDGSVTSEFYGKLDELRLTAAALEFDTPPTEPYTGREPDTVALYHFDDLVDEATVPNAVPHGHLQSRLSVPGDDRLSESMPGFSRALNVVKH